MQGPGARPAAGTWLLLAALAGCAQPPPAAPAAVGQPSKPRPPATLTVNDTPDGRCRVQVSLTRDEDRVRVRRLRTGQVPELLHDGRIAAGDERTLDLPGPCPPGGSADRILVDLPGSTLSQAVELAPASPASRSDRSGTGEPLRVHPATPGP